MIDDFVFSLTYTDVTCDVDGYRWRSYAFTDVTWFHLRLDMKLFELTTTISF